jgi:hypothetical protein
MKIERTQITLSTDMILSGIALLLTLFVLVGFEMLLANQ